MKPDRYTVREAILTTINTRQGVNGRDLVLNCMGMLNPQLFDDEDYANELTQLVVEKEVESLYFFLPYMGKFNMQTIYFPKGTRLVVENHEEAILSNHSQSASSRPYEPQATWVGLGIVSARWKSFRTRFVQGIRRRVTVR